MVWPHLGQVSLGRPLPNVLAEAGAGRVALGLFGPLISALLMRVLTGEGVKGSLGFRRPWRYYAVAVVAPALFIVAVILIDDVTALGRFVSSDAILWTFPAVLIVNGALGMPLSLGEEYGWRGYFLPHLLPLGETKATLIVAGIWSFWHLPALLIGLNYPDQPLWVLPVFLANVVLLAFPFTWLYIDSRASVTAVAVMHSTLDALGDRFTSSTYITMTRSTAAYAIVVFCPGDGP